ncbi:MAG: glycerophosphodiester phosphodiesterase [Lachnospiraceae bacterium]
MINTKIWAHRGASGYAPENTLEAFQKAADMKADGVELDVQMTRDGYLVVIHDETIDRVSDGSGCVKDFTLAELKQFNFNKTHMEYETVRIPTFEEVLNLLNDTDLTINIELKTGIFFYPGIEERVVALVKRMGMESRVLYSSFNHYSIMAIKKLNPDAKTGVLYSCGLYEAAEYARHLGADAIHPVVYNLQYPSLMKDCKENHLSVHVWTVNDRDTMENCYRMGVDAIITNYPDVAKQIREECR